MRLSLTHRPLGFASAVRSYCWCASVQCGGIRTVFTPEPCSVLRLPILSCQISPWFDFFFWRGTFFNNVSRKGTREVNIVSTLRFLHNLKCLHSALTQVWLGIELQVENAAFSLPPNVVVEICEAILIPRPLGVAWASLPGNTDDPFIVSVLNYPVVCPWWRTSCWLSWDMSYIFL